VQIQEGSVGLEPVPFAMKEYKVQAITDIEIPPKYLTKYSSSNDVLPVYEAFAE